MTEETRSHLLIREADGRLASVSVALVTAASLTMEERDGTPVVFLGGPGLKGYCLRDSETIRDVCLIHRIDPVPWLEWVLGKRDD